MQTDDIKDLWRFRDRLINGITTDGFFKISVVKATQLVETARTKHQLNPLTTLILGRLLISSVLSTASLKNEERISFRIESKGPINLVVAEANALGEVRGFLNQPNYIPTDNSKDLVADAIGNGFLHFSKVLYGAESPYISSVPLISSGITQDVGFFFIQSEQIPTAIQTSITFDDKLEIKQASGFIVQSMPSAPSSAVYEMEEYIRTEINLEKMFDERKYVDDMMLHILKGYEVEVLSNRQVDFFCRCSKDRFHDALQSLSLDDLQELSQQAQELVCHFCSTKYYFSADEINQIILKRIR